jgi:DNA-binding transcriptional MerR regulator
MDTKKSNQEAFHSLGVVCRRTGLKPDRLRAWERRYGVVHPERSSGNQRLYSEEDIEHLLLLRQATDGGHRIAHIANLSIDELRDLVAALAPRPPVPPQPATAVELALADSFLKLALDAIQQLDSRWLRSALQQASAELPAAVFLKELLVPLIYRVGELWAEGGLQPAHEHGASAVIRAFLDDMRDDYDIAPDAPVCVIATLSAELHELGALLAAAMAAADGWDLAYLGPNLPAEEIALVARQKGALAVGLSIVYPEAGSDVSAELRKLRRHVGPGIALIAGGHGATAVADTLEEIDAVRVEDLDELRQVLGSIRSDRAISAETIPTN